MKKSVLIEPHYLGSIEYFIAITKEDSILIEVNDHFVKQTYRNRCYVLGPRSSELLSVPVSFRNHTPTKDVTIDYSQSWLKDHARAIRSYYGNAPFFDYFWDYFNDTWQKRPKYLIDLNHEFMTVCLKILQIDIVRDYTTEYHKESDNSLYDLRGLITPKKVAESRSLYYPESYTQLFGNNFVENLSVIDLILCEGTNASEIIRKSSKKKRNN